MDMLFIFVVDYCHLIDAASTITKGGAEPKWLYKVLFTPSFSWTAKHTFIGCSSIALFCVIC
jgi:hypothetical protein